MGSGVLSLGRLLVQGKQICSGSDGADELTAEPLPGHDATSSRELAPRREILDQASQEPGRTGPGADQGRIREGLGRNQAFLRQTVERLRTGEVGLDLLDREESKSVREAHCRIEG